MEMEFNHRGKRINCKVYEREPLLPSDHPTTSFVHLHIHFLHQTTHGFYNRPHQDDDDRRRRHELVFTRRLPGKSADMCVPASRFMESYVTYHGIVTRILTDLGVDPEFHLAVADKVVCSGREFVSLAASDAGRREITVGVDLRTAHVYVRDERELVERGLMESASEAERRGDAGMVAAKAEAVRGLKRKRVVKETGESCRVCLEEFAKGEKVTCMPCRHVFHDGCIKTWLGTSHCCPICRFKMPTDHD